MGTHPIFESDFDCLTAKGSLNFAKMIIYKDLFGGNDELASDTYKIKIIDEVILEIEGKSITYVPGKLDDALFGGNASAEGGVEETEEETVTGCNIVLAHRLSETFFDKKAFTVYIKDFMKKTLKHLKANAQGAVKKILGSFKEWQFFTGESMDPEGSLAFMNYREDGVTPYIQIFIDGLDQEKV